MSFNPSPQVPQELIDAAESGMLVVFIGAGISRLVGCPSWDGFADAVLKQLLPRDVIDYHEKSLIDSIADPRKRLSIAKILDDENGGVIDYKSIFNVDNPRSNVYEFINKFECSFVTTNYDKLIQPECRISDPEEEWRFYETKDLIAAKLNDKGAVIHLHGCVDNPGSMVITTKDYLSHYASQEVPAFLEYLFSSKTVLFLGYGLDETEVLEYVFKYSQPGEKIEKRLFILQGFFNSEKSLFDKLKSYYQDSFNAQLIGFPKDHLSFEQQKEIIQKWGEKLSFNDPALFDERAAMEDEING
ncbi:MAG: hypothetical protein GY941_27180 [Planctomycetes bacterium]|nr:hypothetical protein [Planctomycetota bacterium]